MTQGKKIVMSGMRATGRLHLGNYWGALKNWVAMQEEYDCYFGVADWHMFTTSYEDTMHLKRDVREMVLDWLTAGLDPEKCVIFQQSRVPQHAELALLLSMVTPISWLENNPTYKEQLQELAKTKLSKALEEKQGVLSKSNREKMTGQVLEEIAPDETKAKRELRTHGFLGYPVLQTADIVIYGAHFVPVGHDQLPHIEISREIVRRFNRIYGDVLVEPEPKVTPTPKVPGIDARKMSKSYDNGVALFETPEGLRQKVMEMYTDPMKARAKDPGHPEGCVVFAMHKLYSDYWEKREKECREGALGCVACKKDVLKSMEEPFENFRKDRAKFDQPGRVEDVLEKGSRKAREIAERTMERVRKAMNLR